MSRLLEPGALLRGPLVRNFVRGCVPPSLASGELVGPYRIARELDCGGMSAVYLAHRADGEFEHTVALKWGYCCANPRRQRLFRRERQILARLDHPNIARLIDGGSTRDGHLWFAMEWVDGETLLPYLARTGIDWNQRIDIVLALLDAVAHAHARGFVHCDIKPGNVMIDRRGVPRLLDFGIAGLTGEDPAGTRAFSPGYASPEQLAGRAVGAASDVWQLGRLLHTMMESVRISSRRRREINAITSRAMADDPRRRYPSVAAFSADLKRFAYRQPVHAVGGRLGYVLSCLLRRHPWAVGASVSGSALILVLASLLMAQVARLKTMSAQMESRPAAGIEAPTHDCADQGGFGPPTPSQDCRGWRHRHQAFILDTPTQPSFGQDESRLRQDESTLGNPWSVSQRTSAAEQLAGRVHGEARVMDRRSKLL